MKKIKFIFLISALFLIGCDDDDLLSGNEESPGNTEFISEMKPGGVWLKMDNGMAIGTSYIDYYYASTTTFVLKNHVPYFKNIEYNGSFSVLVDEEEIYKCAVRSMLSSFIPDGANYMNIPYNQIYIIPISFVLSSPDNGNNIPDLRNDIRIVEALKKYGQYYEGLNFDFQSVGQSSGKMVITGELYNPDAIDYYYLDPEKMSMEFFHYVTNGLTLYDFKGNNFKIYTHKIKSDSWESLNKKWMSLIKSGERKKISISYSNFDKVPPGNYKAYFNFPGLTYQMKQNEIEQADGRIWIGEISASKDVIIE